MAFFHDRGNTTGRLRSPTGRHLIVGYASDVEAEERAPPIQPSIYGNFDFAHVPAALEALARRETTGRIVVRAPLSEG